MEGIKKVLFHHAKFKNLSDFGINPDAKEAVLFAILANETVTNPNPTYLPAFNEKFPMVTFGKISLPG